MYLQRDASEYSIVGQSMCICDLLMHDQRQAFALTELSQIFDSGHVVAGTHLRRILSIALPLASSSISLSR
jgi:hypothetical protein